jgi:hypothetical protein
MRDCDFVGVLFRDIGPYPANLANPGTRNKK